MSPEVVLLTTSEVAKILRVDGSTIRRWVAEGRLPAVTLPGGLFRFHLADIEAILATGQPQDGAA